jgi:tRNA A64-2'-O-ribosylphosphate transferase
MSFTTAQFEQPKFHQLTRKVEKRANNIYARLKSIERDSSFAKQVCAMFPDLPCYANMRCGQWYLPDFDGTCYFKSTDGHTHHWKFSPNRLNLHILTESDRHGGLIIIDSTRKGKKFPDSFSKTIPIWACVLNRVLSSLNRSTEQWNNELNLPIWVHRTEKLQILEKIDKWVDNVLNSGLDFSNIQISKPIRCIWLSQTSHLESIQLGYKSLSFTPLVTDKFDFLALTISSFL